MSVAHLRFYGTLNDFLSPAEKDNEIEVHFRSFQSVKDIIESLGVPHVEVQCILVNGTRISLNGRLHDLDNVSVYPFEGLSAQGGSHRFLIDEHLGKLARNLRLLGFDSVLRKVESVSETLDLAASEQRTLLTRSLPLLKHKQLKHGYWIRSQEPLQQVIEVWERFNLKGQASPFRRCLICNGPIIKVAKEQVIDRLEEKTRQYYSDYYQCSNCQRIFWKGSHYERMLKFLRKLP